MLRERLSGCWSVLAFAAAFGAVSRVPGMLGAALMGTVALVGCCRVYPAVRRWRRARALKLADVDGMDGLEFEDYVADLLERQGYEVELTQCSGDLGVDVIAWNQQTSIAVQVKRYDYPVSRRAVSDAVAGREHYECDAAMVVTNSYFTRGAEDLAASTQCQLVDRDALAEWISRYGR